MNDPVDTLQQARLRLAQLPDPSCQAVAEAIGRYLAGSAPTLDQALGLGGSCADRAKAARDYWLREAWQALDGPLGFARSRKLADELGRFESCVWPRWRDLEATPEGASRLRVALWHAFRCARAYHIPRTAQGLDNIANF